MVINDFNIVGIAALPSKANSPLFIDADTVLPLPFAFQLLKMVCRRDAQCFEDGCGMNDFKLYSGNSLNRLRQFRGEPALEYFFGLLAGE